MWKCGPRRLRVVIVLGTVTLGLACAAGTAAVTGARINTSYSLPLGIYIRTDDARTALIEFCPVGP